MNRKLLLSKGWALLVLVGALAVSTAAQSTLPEKPLQSMALLNR